MNRAEVKLRLVMEEREITLGEAADLKVGQVLRLQASPKTRMKLESNKQPLFWCQLGQAEGGYVVKIEDPVDLDQSSSMTSFPVDVVLLLALVVTSTVVVMLYLKLRQLSASQLEYERALKRRRRRWTRRARRSPC